jgi:hypothetical protein
LMRKEEWRKEARFLTRCFSLFDWFEAIGKSITIQCDVHGRNSPDDYWNTILENSPKTRDIYCPQVSEMEQQPPYLFLTHVLFSPSTKRELLLATILQLLRFNTFNIVTIDSR